MTEQAELFDAPPPRWRVSAAWCIRKHDCTLRGIMERCGGVCCKSQVFWPPRTGGPGGCKHLTPVGCKFTPRDRPVVCLLYPLRLNSSNCLVLHHRATTAKGHCHGNHGRGDAVIDALGSQLIALFGEAQYARVRADVMAGRDSYFDVPPAVLRAYEAELRMDKENTIPPPRSEYEA